MKRNNPSVLLVLPLLAAVLATLPAAPAVAAASAKVAGENLQPRSGLKQARTMLDEAAGYLEENGPQRAFAAFNNQKGRFYRDDLYTFVVGIDDGIMHAHGGAPEGIVGADVRDLRDAAGKPIIREMLAVAQKGGGSLDYVWLNRVTNRVENKTTLLRQVGKYVVGVGYYVPRSTAEQAEALLRVAVAEARKSPQAAFAAFNDPKGPYVREDLYVFAVGLDDARFAAMGVNPKLVGTEVAAMRDAAGKPIISEMIAMARAKGSGTVDYVWRNPVTNKVENKHSRIERLDNYLIGVGYYTR